MDDSVFLNTNTHWVSISAFLILVNALDLSYIFFSTDRLSLEFKDDKYVVLSYGKKVELNKLSIGERNAIALCYFFAQVLENTNESNEYGNDFFLIMVIHYNHPYN